MTDIGSTLRDTRIRSKIDIAAVEQATKIRAKYLRALENEEWGVLPGPSYVKSFLRTYAEYLGLDAQMLVEEHDARYEELEELELPVFGSEKPLRRRVGRVGPPSRLTTIIVLVVALLAFLLVLGQNGGKKGGERSTAAKQKTSSQRSAADKSANQKGKTTSGRSAPPPGRVRVSVVAKRDVWVCLVDAKGGARVNGVTLTAGARAGPFTSSRFKVTLGNGGGDLAVNGKRRDTPESADPLGYAVSPEGVRSLPDTDRPTCG